ncbi:MAG: 5-(carboxyamino)imidazole ribonucleotide mutase [Armatimonadetes bacterium]|nr:5-(carboxyamino)imidazole ribonucleotide mutase [Armatimonadota bacterium]
MSESPKVLILLGSASDEELMRPCWEQLRELGVPYEARVASAHRTPDLVRELVSSARKRGIQVIIAGAGMAAHLAGAVAALTTLPVIAVPLAGSPLGGLDALLSSVQMPPGVPVATVAINGARNAGVLAAQILALSDEDLASRLQALRDTQAAKILAARIGN